MFPPGHSHYRAPPIHARDNRNDDVQLLSRGSGHSLELRHNAIDHIEEFPPHSVSRREGSIDGDDTQSDDEFERAPSQRRRRVESTCSSEGKSVPVASDSDESDDDFVRPPSAPISRLYAH